MRRWTLSVAAMVFLGLYLVLFLSISNLLLRDLKDLPFMTDARICLNYARPDLDSPWRVFLRGNGHPR